VTHDACRRQDDDRASARRWLRVPATNFIITRRFNEIDSPFPPHDSYRAMAIANGVDADDPVLDRAAGSTTKTAAPDAEQLKDLA